MSKTTRVSEAIARPARTAIQAAPSAIITEFIDSFFYDMADKQYAALLMLLTLLFAWIQAAYENAKGRGLWFRAVGPTEQPVEGA